MSTSEELEPPPGDFDPSSFEPAAKACMAAAALAKAPIGDSLEGVEFAVVSGVSEAGGSVAGMSDAVDPALEDTGPASTDSGTPAKGISKRVEVCWPPWVIIVPLLDRTLLLLLDLSTLLLVLTFSSGLVPVDPMAEVDEGWTGLPGMVSPQTRSRSSPWPLGSSTMPLLPPPLALVAAAFLTEVTVAFDGFLDDALLRLAEVALFSLRLETVLRIRGSSSSTVAEAAAVTTASASTNSLRRDFLGLSPAAVEAADFDTRIFLGDVLDF